MISFAELFARADTEILASLAGPDTVRLLGVLGEDYTRPHSLAKLVLAIRPPADLLGTAQSRSILLELLRPAEAEALAERLRCSTQSLLGRLTRKQVEELSALLGHPATAPPDETAGNTAVAPAAPLFPHQRRALSGLREALGGAHGGRALLHMPTGSGKTRTTMNFVAELLRIHEAGSVLWLAASTELCEQAADEFASSWSTLGNRPIRVIRAWAGQTPRSDEFHDAFVVASVATARERWIRDAVWVAGVGDRVTLTVFDEAHQALAPWSHSLLDALMARRPDARLLGLSATPGRTWNDPAEDAKLAALFSRTKVTLSVPGYHSPIDFLIEKQYLARPTFVSAKWRSAEPPLAERRVIQDAFEIPDRLLEQLAGEQLRSLRIVREMERLAQHHTRIILFATTVRHARILAAVLAARGIATRFVTSDTPTEARRAAISWFKGAGSDIRVLTNFGVLTTGFDAPRTSAAVIARPTKSLVLYSQMVGRALRGREARGNDTAEIVTIDDFDLPGFRNPTEMFFNWEDVW